MVTGLLPPSYFHRAYRAQQSVCSSIEFCQTRVFFVRRRTKQKNILCIQWCTAFPLGLHKRVKLRPWHVDILHVFFRFYTRNSSERGIPGIHALTCKYKVTQTANNTIQTSRKVLHIRIRVDYTYTFLVFMPSPRRYTLGTVPPPYELPVL